MLYTPIKMIRACLGYLVMACFVLLFSCKDSKPTSADARVRFESIIPKPVSATMSGRTFTLTNETRIVTEGPANGLMAIANFLKEKIEPATGFDMEISGEATSDDGAILLSLEVDNDELGAEGHELSIEEDGIK